MNKNILTIGIICLFIISTISPIAFGYNIKISKENEPEAISINDIMHYTDFETSREVLLDVSEHENHHWPMYKHDARHTGLSEYDTSLNPGFERWKYFIDSSITSTAVIDCNGILYVAANMKEFHAIYPDGSRKWKQDLIGYEGFDPAIGPDGTIYVGTFDRFHAFYPNGTVRWILNKNKNFVGYPSIDQDGIVYVGTSDGYLYAIYPNGTIKWEYKIDANIRAPALDNDNNIYFTTRDGYLYCLSPNGSFRWKFNANAVFDNGPVIGDDGTIYLVPRSDKLIAVKPNGTKKWQTKMTDGGGMPSLAPDGTIIVSGKYSDVSAYDPIDGSILWTHHIDDENIEHVTSAAIGADGTIYFAYSDYIIPKKGYICALTSGGYLKWKTRLTTDIYPYIGMSVLSDPSIGSDGTVYITTWFRREGSNYTNIGYLHAIGELDPNAPSAPTITGPISGKAGEQYNYTFKSTSPIDNDVYYWVEWGDYGITEWIGPYTSGEEVTVSYKWDEPGTYKIRAKSKDTDNLWGPWGEFEVTIKEKSRAIHSSLFLQFLDGFPQLQKVLLYLIK